MPLFLPKSENVEVRMLVTASAVLVSWRLVQFASSVSVARVWMSAVKLQGTVLYCTVLYCTVLYLQGTASSAEQSASRAAIRASTSATGISELEL